MHLVDVISQDVRQVARALARTPGFTGIAVVTLALGIGVVTTMFTVANAAIVRPLPFERPHQLYEVRKIAAGGGRVWLSLPELQEWQSQNRAFSGLAGSTAFDFNLRGNPPSTISATGVTPGYLELLGVHIHIGRRFVETEYGSGSDRVVLLTYPFWQQRFGADPNVIGTTLELEGPFHLSDSTGRYTVIGVLAPEFWHFFDRTRTHVVLPLRASASHMADRNRRLVERVIGRLSDTSASVAAEGLRRISDTEDRQFLQSSANVSVDVLPLADAHFGTVRRTLILLLASTLVVAVIASANVALLFLARGYTRRHELAVRASLGANRLALARLQLIEAGIVALAGAVLGGAVSLWGLQIVRLLIPSAIGTMIPGGVEAIGHDGTTLLAVMLVTMALAVCAGSAPAWLAFRTDATAPLRTARQVAHAGLSMQRILVVAEVALAVTLLAGSALLLNSMVRLNRVNLGITPPAGIVVWINLNLSRYPDNEAKTRFYDRLIEALDTQPQVSRTSAVDQPFNLDWLTVPFALEGQVWSNSRELPRALDRAVSPGYFAHHGIGLRQGRRFDERDNAGSPAVAIVSATLARRAWPGEVPLGRRLRLVERPSEPVEVTVVGVVSDIRHAPQHEPMPIVYRPYAQHSPPWMYLSVEGTGGAEALLHAVRDAVAGVDVLQPVDGPWTLAEWMRYPTTQARLMTTLASVFAGSALLLAALGIYGVLTQVVARRDREFGIRIAVGATPARILWTASSLGLGLSSVGIAVGIGGAIVLTRTLEGMLFGVSPTDPATLATVAALFGGVSWIASIIPAYGATRVDPMLILRVE